MSALTEALEELENWLCDNYPNQAASLPPGLTPEEINSIAENLPFELPTEIRELYEWHDGSGNFSILLSNYMEERVGFSSLEKAVDNSDEYEAGHITQKLGINGFHLFPEFERWVHFSVCNNSEISPIWIVTDDPYIRLGYTSITSMVLTTLECYQSGILEIGNYLYDYEDFLGVWNQNNHLTSFFKDEYYRQIVDIFEDIILKLYSEGERDFYKYKFQRRRYDFRNSKLDGSNFSGIHLAHSKFNESDLMYTNFSNTDLTRVDFSNANLQGANFFQSNLSRTRFHNANLQGAHLNRVDLRDSDIKNTIMPDGSLMNYRNR